jgi:hypothetical protein
MFEPPPSKRRSWIWVVGLVSGAGFLVVAFTAGGPWYFLILGAIAVWTFLAVRFLMSQRGRNILFSRFDEPQPPGDPRRN